jgi:hypothetical protein
MEPNEQLGEARTDRPLRPGQRAVLEDQAVRKRELEVARDEHRRKVAALDDADDIDRRDLVVLERGQESVLTPRERLRQLLQREQTAVERDELDDVAMDPDRRLGECLRRPLLERAGPRQCEERALVAARDEPERCRRLCRVSDS